MQDRERARRAYERGELAEAIAIQQCVSDEDADVLFLGLMLHAARRFDDSIAVLRDGIARFPANPAMHENLAVLLLSTNDTHGAIAACLRALALGSDSPNVHDCLGDAYNREGQQDRAIAAGWAALEAKDRLFGDRTPIVAMPADPPPPFDPTCPAENVISYCLWGNEPRYYVPLLENARIQPHLFPSWTIRLYHDASVDTGYLTQLRTLGVDSRPMALPPGVTPHRRLLWRFAAAADPEVHRFLIRDADSLLSVKERVAVDAWLQSGYRFHAMRDWFTHTDLLLAGLWGGVGGILPPVESLLEHYTAWRVENDHVDQDLLAETVWPAIRRDVLIHDSVFTGCLGSVPFPPFGAMLPGMHIGQNAFHHFAPAG
ncbi:MAG: tetratricopeptide repeat protein [Rhodospirillales bacterium]